MGVAGGMKGKLKIPTGADSAPVFIDVEQIDRIESDDYYAKLLVSAGSHERAKAFMAATNAIPGIDPDNFYISNVCLKGWNEPPFPTEHLKFHDNKIIGSTAFAEDLVAEYDRLLKEAQ